jgi:hypothetical protein
VAAKASSTPGGLAGGVDVECAAHRAAQSPAVAAGLESHNGVRIDDQASDAGGTFGDLGHLALQIASIVGARGEVRGSDLQTLARQPLDEVSRPIRPGAHIAGSNVEAVMRIMRRIGRAQADRNAPLEQDHLRVARLA